jgi:hypothetical protein
MLGLASKSVLPVRKEPNETTEMVNQLLFGEKVSVLETYKQWLRIESTLDSYHGWVDSRLIEIIKDDTDLNSLNDYIINDWLVEVKDLSNSSNLLLSPGSFLYKPVNNRFKLYEQEFEIQNSSITTAPPTAENLIKTALRFLNVPYLWGGKSIFGIDCSGFVQVCYRTIGKFLPRDAWQQAKHGQTIEFSNYATAGDLAFFDNEEGQITHTGILISPNEIIHSSGYVRIDKFDHLGIFNNQLGEYTHKLRIIKRLL